ncbi:MAG: flagellar protein FlaG [Lachnospiraceae bacterium]|nr:flagellar protein FlaG [Lachnospiraceae bacterium]
MSYQAQSAPETNTKPVEKVSNAEAVEVAKPEYVDQTTATVNQASAQYAGSENSGDNNATTNEEQLAKQNEKLRKAVAEVNKQANTSELQFGYHEGTHRVTLKVIDKDTKEVIKELPPEKTLDMIAKVWEIAGIMVDEKR